MIDESKAIRPTFCTCTSNKRRVFFSPLLYIEEEEQETSYKKNKEKTLSSLTDERFY